MKMIIIVNIGKGLCMCGYFSLLNERYDVCFFVIQLRKILYDKVIIYY